VNSFSSCFSNFFNLFVFALAVSTQGHRQKNFWGRGGWGGATKKDRKIALKPLPGRKGTTEKRLENSKKKIKK